MISCRSYLGCFVVFTQLMFVKTGLRVWCIFLFISYQGKAQAPIALKLCLGFVVVSVFCCLGAAFGGGLYAVSRVKTMRCISIFLLKGNFCYASVLTIASFFPRKISFTFPLIKFYCCVFLNMLYHFWNYETVWRFHYYFIIAGKYLGPGYADDLASAFCWRRDSSSGYWDSNVVRSSATKKSVFSTCHGIELVTN